MTTTTRKAAPWGAVVALSLTVMAAFGVILYGFSIFVTDEAAGADFSKTVLSIAYGGSVVSGGLLAIPLGMRADRRGIRAIVTAGGLLAGGGMWLFASANQSWQVLAAWWLLLGPAGAMMFYETAFVAVDQWFSLAHRPRALGTLTLIGGLAGIIFIPLIDWAVGRFGWRDAAVASGVLVMATALATAAIALRNLPHPETSHHPQSATRLSRRLFGDRKFVIYTAAMVITFFAAQGLIAHRIARFDESGFEVSTVALWAAAASAFSLPGRWLAPIVATRFRPADVQAASTALLAVGTALMLDGTKTWQLAGHFTLFGLAFGAVLPLRAMTMAGWYSGPRYGATMGTQWTITTIVGALGPAAVGLLRDTTAGYESAVVMLFLALGIGTALLVVATRTSTADSARSAPTRSPD